MAVSTMYGILLIISLKRYTMCGPRIYSYHFKINVVLPTGGLKEGLNILLS